MIAATRRTVAAATGPLSHAQLGMWFLERRAGSTLYAEPMTFRLTGEVDVRALHAAVEDVVRRHDALRTRFTVVDGAPRQYVVPDARVPLARIDLAYLPPDQRHRRAERLLRAELGRPIDLAAGPLVRATLIRLAPHDHVFRLTLHHLVCDAWSWWMVVLRELEQLYARRVAGVRTPLEPVRTHYADFVDWQERWLESPAYARQVAHWRRALAGVTPLPELALARTTAPVPHTSCATEWEVFPQPLYDGLRALGRREHVTLYMLLLTAFTRVLRRHVPGDDILVGTRGGFRSRPEFEKTVGLFVNMLPIRARVTEDAGFHELLPQVRDTLLGTYLNRDLPFERLVAELGLRRPGPHPVINVCVSFQTTPEVMPRLPGLETTLVNHDPYSPFDLDLGFYTEDGGLRALMIYNPARYTREAVRHLLDALRRELEEATRPAEASRRAGSVRPDDAKETPV
ncbi:MULTISPECIES: condensation domain-containing protein [unclassified Streptomyces]|uniref:condensation domain-containing protein n=1 Tax=unclassified Streptomyces TaxID=2593676 RepID=UPI0034059E36